MPTVSVVIPTRDRAQYILETVDSVLAQTYRDYEIVVVDDGSTDDTRRILGKLIDAGEVRYEHQSPQGVSVARNRGISLAAGTHIAFLDSDDLFMPTKLQKQMAVFAAQPNLGFVHCSFRKFDDAGRDLGVRDTSRHVGWIYPRILHEWSVLMAMPCMLARKEVLVEVGGFDESMRWAEDMDLWRRISRKYEVGVAPEVLVKVRVHTSSTTFVRADGAQGFERYLEKAFNDDKRLSLSFKRQATAKMYAKFGENLLGEGDREKMSQVRAYSIVALRAWPLQLSALAVLVASFLPRWFRHQLATLLRGRRYPSLSSESL